MQFSDINYIHIVCANFSTIHLQTFFLSLRLKPCTYETIAVSSSYFGFSDHLPLQAGTVANSNPQLVPPSFLTREMRNPLPFVPNPPNPSGGF